MSNETEVTMNRRLQEHEAIMRLADDYADELGRIQQIGMPSKKRSELYNALWKALKL